jgi:hypothetical protein
MGDALIQMVTQGDAPNRECVTLKAVVRRWFTGMVTQVTQICREVPNACAGGRVIAKVRHGASCVTNELAE